MNRSANTTMRVAHVTAVDSSFIYVFYNQLKELRKRGLDITCIATQELPENGELLKKIGVKFIEVPIQRKLTPFADLVSVYRLYKVFKREKFDIIHTQLPKATLLGAIAGWLSNTPVVNTARPLFRELQPGLRKTFLVWIEKVAHFFTDRVMVENPFDYQNYIDFGITPKEKLSVQGHGIDLTQFDPAKVRPEDVDKLRAEFKIPKSARVIGIVGRYVYEKGFQELFTAFKELHQKYPDLYLVAKLFVLPSERGTVPEDLPARMGFADRMVFITNLRDMEVVYALFDIFALPTWRDSFPRSLIEAAAMGLPIVASDIQGCQVVVENEKSGLLVPLKDSRAMAKALERLLENPGFAKGLGAKAHKFALENLDEQKICQIILDCYKTLLEKKK
jgi:glycosyltransferase involved in cell wall biosynthesis